MLHRTQIMLETNQYELLKEVARRRQQSLSAVLREIVDRWSVHQQDEWDQKTVENDPIWELCGLIPTNSNVDPAASEHLDPFIYRADWQEKP